MNQRIHGFLNKRRAIIVDAQRHAVWQLQLQISNGSLDTLANGQRIGATLLFNADALTDFAVNMRHRINVSKTIFQPGYVTER